MGLSLLQTSGTIRSPTSFLGYLKMLLLGPLPVSQAALPLSILFEHMAVTAHVPDTGWQRGHSLTISSVCYLLCGPLWLPSLLPPQHPPALNRASSEDGGQ